MRMDTDKNAEIIAETQRTRKIADAEQNFACICVLCVSAFYLQV